MHVKGGQKYLAYGMVFNTISHYLGKEKMYTILKDFFDTYKNREAQYPTSLDFIKLLKKETPEHLMRVLEFSGPRLA